MLNNFLVGFKVFCSFCFQHLYFRVRQVEISLSGHKTNYAGASGPYNLSENYDCIDDHQKASACFTAG